VGPYGPPAQVTVPPSARWNSRNERQPLLEATRSSNAGQDWSRSQRWSPTRRRPWRLAGVEHQPGFWSSSLGSRLAAGKFIRNPFASLHRAPGRNSMSSVTSRAWSRRVGAQQLFDGQRMASGSVAQTIAVLPGRARCQSDDPIALTGVTPAMRTRRRFRAPPFLTGARRTHCAGGRSTVLARFLFLRCDLLTEGE